METGLVAAFAAMSLLLVLTPGADWAYAVAAGLRDRSVVPAVGGIVLGYAGLTTALAAGVAAVIAGTPGLLTGLTSIGAAYLIWLGASTLARPGGIGADASGTNGARAASPWRAVLRGVGVSGLNPKALMLYLALLPQFVDQHGAWPVPAQMGLLGAVHMLACGCVYLGVGAFARTVLRTRPAVARAVTRTSGVVMIALGGLLLAEHLVG